jgi:hypothetical protein
VDPDLQGELLRILLAQVDIEKIGGRPSNQFEVSWYKPRMLDALDTKLDQVRIRDESEQALRAVRPRLDDLFRDASPK